METHFLKFQKMGHLIEKAKAVPENHTTILFCHFGIHSNKSDMYTNAKKFFLVNCHISGMHIIFGMIVQAF